MTDSGKLLRELVAVPSVNPAFLPENHPHAGEERLAQHLAAALAQAGLEIDFQKVLPRRSNLLVRLRPAGKIKRRILLAPHLDTVAAFSADQFVPRVRNGRLYGCGACDTKGSIAAFVTALVVLARNGPLPPATEIVFAGLVDEENAQVGSRALAASSFRAHLAIVGEPTRLRIVTAHKGAVWLRFQTHGKSAHGSCPHLGRNAVHEMARVVDLLESDYAQRLQQRRHPLLGCASISVGSMHGGTQPNIVPSSCHASADRRTLPGETEQSVRSELRALFRRHGLRPTIGSETSYSCVPLQTDPRLPLVRAFFHTARQKEPCGANYFCDASVLAQAGIPSVVFGPGDIAQAHTAAEWISLASVESATQLLLKFFRSLP